MFLALDSGVIKIQAALSPAPGGTQKPPLEEITNFKEQRGSTFSAANLLTLLADVQGRLPS